VNELGEQAQVVDAVPVLGDFAVGDAHDIDDQNLDAAAGRRNALHGTAMRPVEDFAGDDHVTLLDLIQDGGAIGRPTNVCLRQQVVLHGEERRGGTTRDADAGVDVLHVVLGGASRDHQAIGDLRVAQAACDEP